jgi:hypothetical protein
MAYRLFVDSSNGVTIEPEWDFKYQDKKIEDEHRMRSGGRYVYKWGSFKKWKVPVNYVNSSFMAIVNSYWASNTALLFKSQSDSAVYSVQITNDDLPIAEFVKPYDTLFKGVIELETY